MTYTLILIAIIIAAGLLALRDAAPKQPEKPDPRDWRNAVYNPKAFRRPPGPPRA